MTKEETAWLAGLMEGEGCFFVDSRPRGRPALRVKLDMTDRDVVVRASRLVPGGSTAISRFVPTKGTMPAWVFRWNGARAESLMRAILPYMGERRSVQIKECLSTPNLSHYPRKATT